MKERRVMEITAYQHSALFNLPKMGINSDDNKGITMISTGMWPAGFIRFFSSPVVDELPEVSSPRA